ncbi:hypothetical protein NKG94_14535 [Micromonospora sp. M12]
MLYLVIAAESPGCCRGGRPRLGRGAGEDTALDTACADVDREARRLLDREPLVLWSIIQESLAVAERSGDWQIRQDAIRQAALLRTMMTPRVGYAGEPYVEGLPVVGARQILDALLIVADDGHAPAPGSPAHAAERWAVSHDRRCPVGSVRSAGGLSHLARRSEGAAVGPCRGSSRPGRPGGASSVSEGASVSLLEDGSI